MTLFSLEISLNPFNLIGVLGASALPVISRLLFLFVLEICSFANIVMLDRFERHNQLSRRYFASDGMHGRMQDNCTVADTDQNKRICLRRTMVMSLTEKSEDVSLSRSLLSESFVGRGILFCILLELDGLMRCARIDHQTIDAIRGTGYFVGGMISTVCTKESNFFIIISDNAYPVTSLVAAVGDHGAELTSRRVSETMDLVYYDFPSH